MSYLVFFTLLLYAVSCSHGPTHEKDWDQFAQALLQKHFQAHPDEAVSQGRHEFDGQLPDWSAHGLKLEAERLTSDRVKILAFADSQLTEDQKFARKYLLAAIDSEFFWLTRGEQPYVNPSFFSNSLSPTPYVILDYTPAATRMQAFIKYAKVAPKAVRQIQANLRLPLALPLLNQGQLVFKGLSVYVLDDVPKAFASVPDRKLQEELKAAAREASQAFLSFNDWLESQRATATPSYALGADRLQEMLAATEGVTAPIAAIEKAGRDDMAKNDSRLQAACAKFAPGRTIMACAQLEAAKKSSDDMLTVARRQLLELDKFVLGHDLVTIPSPDKALVAWTPPFMRWNSAFIQTTGFYDKGLPSTYYISPPDSKWSAKDRMTYLRSEPDLLLLSIHEVWPGHFLDALVRNTLSPPAGFFGTYAAIEGWAHYSEEMMIDSGLRSGDPQVKVAQALAALLRDVRLISAIGLHTGALTEAQSEQLFLDKAYTDPKTAKQQSARGVFDPSYLKYTLGKLMIRKLRDDWCASRGGQQAWKQFHDSYLSYGDAPIPLVRAAMMGTTQGELF